MTTPQNDRIDPLKIFPGFRFPSMSIVLRSQVGSIDTGMNAIGLNTEPCLPALHQVPFKQRLKLYGS